MNQADISKLLRLKPKFGHFGYQALLDKKKRNESI